MPHDFQIRELTAKKKEKASFSQPMLNSFEINRFITTSGLQVQNLIDFLGCWLEYYI